MVLGLDHLATLPITTIPLCMHAYKQTNKFAHSSIKYLRSLVPVEDVLLEAVLVGRPVLAERAGEGLDALVHGVLVLDHVAPDRAPVAALIAQELAHLLVPQLHVLLHVGLGG